MMKDNRNTIKRILEKNGVSASYKKSQSKDFPRSVFFLVTNSNLTSSNYEYAGNPSFQISLFTTNVDDELMEKIKRDFNELPNCFVGNWQEGPVDDEIDFIFHNYIEVSFING